MNWHVEHHMYAGVPCYNLKALATEIKSDMPEPKTLLNAWKEMRRTWQRQKSDPNYEFDTTVPTPVDVVQMPADNATVTSIGDLGRL